MRDATRLIARRTYVAEKEKGRPEDLPLILVVQINLEVELGTKVSPHFVEFLRTVYAETAAATDTTA